LQTSKQDIWFNKNKICKKLFLIMTTERLDFISNIMHHLKPVAAISADFFTYLI